MFDAACRLTAATAAALLATVSPIAASAAPLAVQSYSMPNGNGQASGGSFNYWDRSYNGSGATTTDGAPLSGGTGDLTDGVVAGNLWLLVENSAGTGPYVGWRSAGTLNPTVTFDFGASAIVDEIRIHIDNSEVGAVYAPADIRINGVSRVFTAPAAGSIGWVSFTGLGLTGNTLDIQFFQANQGWTFVSEVQFDGTPGERIPEPATAALMLAGLGLAGLTRRRAARRPRC